MTHYLDIHLLPDPEFPPHQLLGALYSKLHRALVRMQAPTLAVAFPGYSEQAHTLGHVLRLIGPAADLARLMALNWLVGMHDHVKASDPQPVPANATHRLLQRVQAKSNPERLRRRQIKRHGLTEAQALERIPNSATELLSMPFVRLTSASTGQTFPLFLRLGPTQPAVSGSFNAYGLSPTATIPCF